MATKAGNWFTANRASAELIGFCVLVTFVALFIAGRARKQLGDLEIGRMQVEHVANSIDQWQTRFRPVTPAERNDWARLEAAGARFATGSGGRFFLAQDLTQLAEGAGLKDVRVRFAPDSAPQAQAATASGSTLTPSAADYQVRMTFSGSFAAAARFVSSLPGIASPLQLTAGRQNGSGVFTLVLSVHEVKAANGTG